MTKTTRGIDWKADMDALDVSLPERLERVAQMAETADYWVDEHRLMPAAGVADILYEALDEIKQYRGIEQADAQAALERVKREARNEALDAASEYLKTVYGNSPLSHPVDRKRILALMEDTDDD